MLSCNFTRKFKKKKCKRKAFVHFLRVSLSLLPSLPESLIITPICLSLSLKSSLSPSSSLGRAKPLTAASPSVISVFSRSRDNVRPPWSASEIIMTGLAPDSYDVFINFRGEDTRHGFTGNLYNSLKYAGVRTFLDDEELRRGDEITPTLLKAIENSSMAITVFSENYASSTFCLNELVHIHECMKRKGLLVWPIFYDVEPSEVRHQKDNYKTELSMHMEKHRADEDKIKRWKLALHEVANISGDHFNPRQDYEYQFIERIVKEISGKIDRVLLHVSEHPVGLEPRVKEITDLLQIGSNDKVIMVGICGMGGLGKTTAACALYNSIVDNFDGLCFLDDVKEKSEKLGLERIQETMLSKIVGEEIKIKYVNEGVQVIKKRFKGKKILLILDNIDKHEQLKKLAGNCDWFSAGSRIIITTRDEQLLAAHGVESIYYMEVFNDEESFELLSRNAFRNRQVDPCYKDVLKRAITYAQGLPLALEVIGSNLCRKPINEWESALDSYKLSLHKDIEQVLRVSYEDLEEVEKEIFLDTACAFNKKELKYVKYMVEAVHDSNDLSYSIRVLVDKCLIKITKCYNYIKMHDLIRDMGRKIVREESPNNPGEWSRLWFPQDIVDVLQRNTGTNKVRMIVLNNWRECIEVNWDGEAFKSMKELKILIFDNVQFLESPKYLPNSLKVLKWSGYPSSCFPPNFSPKKLVVLDIGDSYLSSLEEIKTSDNLGILNLEACNYVKEIPDLSNLKSLKELSLGECRNLIGIHDSIGYLPKLEILDVFRCRQLKNFPRAIKLPSLSNLNLVGCSSLKYFPEILENVKETVLYLYDTGIRELPWSICNLSELREFSIRGVFDSVCEIPNSIFLLPNLERISAWGNEKGMISFNSKEAQEAAIWSQQCPNKVSISLPGCNISNDFLRTNLSRYVNVKYLNLSGCDFTILPAWIKECHFLETLFLEGCKHLREVEGIPPNIRRLDAKNCVSLSLESQSLLLSEELHGAPGRYNHDSEQEEKCLFWVPSRSIPKWVDHRCKGASISFWFRHSFPPALCLCVLLKSTCAEFWPAQLYINYKRASSYHWLSFNVPLKLDDDHLVVYYLQGGYIENFETKRLLLEDRWYHAEFCAQYEASGQTEIGMYAIKQLCDMENITFTNPYPQIWDFTWGDQVEQPDTRMEEKVAPVNKKRRLTGNDNFASSSTAFICPINQDDNDATPQVPFVKACEIINNSKETSFGDLDLNTTSLPMLPRTEQACDTFTNQGHSTEDEKGALLASLLENIHL